MTIVLAASLQAQWSTDPNNNLVIGVGWDPHIVSDSAGGCYVTFNYESFYPQKLAVERLDMFGFKPWGDKKQILGELPEQWQAEIVEDGEGGVIVSYEDNQVVGTDYTTRVRVQRVDSNGNFLWGQTGTRVNVTESNHGAQELVSDGEGGCVIVWQNIDASYWINRINQFGQREWGDTGIAIGNGNGKWIIRASDGNYYVQTGLTVHRIGREGQILNQYSVSLGYPVPDPNGGIVLSGRVWNGMIPKLVAQRKDSLGNNLWQEPYIEIADSLYINTPINIREINGYYYYYWYGYKDGIQLVTQYQVLRPNGTKLFSNGSISVSEYPVDALLADIIPSDSGTVVFIWQDYRPDDGVFGQRKDTLNNKFWNSNDIPIYTGMYADLYAITDGDGGTIGLGWHQFDFSIRAFKVSKNGILGEVITGTDDQNELIIPDEIILYQNFPNPFNPSTIIKYQIPKVETHRDASLQMVKLIIYDVLGNEVATLVNEEKPAGEYEIEFTATGLSSGIYFYKLEAGNFIQTKKMILLK